MFFVAMLPQVKGDKMKVKDLLKKHIIDAESFKVIEDQHNGLSKVLMEKKSIAEVLEMQELLEKEVAEVLTTDTGEIEVWVDEENCDSSVRTISLLKKKAKVMNMIMDISLVLVTLILLYFKTTLIPDAGKNTINVNITPDDVLSLLFIIGMLDRKFIRTPFTCILTILTVLINGFVAPQIGKYINLPMINEIFASVVEVIYVGIMGYIFYLENKKEKNEK